MSNGRATIASRPCGAGLGREIALGLSNRGLRVFGTGLLADAGAAMEPHRGGSCA